MKLSLIISILNILLIKLKAFYRTKSWPISQNVNLRLIKSYNVEICEGNAIFLITNSIITQSIQITNCLNNKQEIEKEEKAMVRIGTEKRTEKGIREEKTTEKRIRDDIGGEKETGEKTWRDASKDTEGETRTRVRARRLGLSDRRSTAGILMRAKDTMYDLHHSPIVTGLKTSFTSLLRKPDHAVKLETGEIKSLPSIPHLESSILSTIEKESEILRLIPTTAIKSDKVVIPKSDIIHMACETKEIFKEGSTELIPICSKLLVYYISKGEIDVTTAEIIFDTNIGLSEVQKKFIGPFLKLDLENEILGKRANFLDEFNYKAMDLKENFFKLHEAYLSLSITLQDFFAQHQEIIENLKAYKDDPLHHLYVT
jgi:hypothetical protein